MVDAFGTFVLDLRQFAESIPDEMVKPVVQKLAMHALRGVVLKSPVKSGRFRGNWNVSVNVADMTVTEAVDKSGGATIAKARPPLRLCRRIAPSGSPMHFRTGPVSKMDGPNRRRPVSSP